MSITISLKQHFNFIDSGFAELLREFGETPERASSPVLDQILGAESVDYRDKITILYDLVLAGIQTV